MTLNEFLVDHYEDPFQQGTCDYPTHRARATHRTLSCRDYIQVELRIVDDTIVEAWFDGEACKVALASASAVMEKVTGQTIEQFERHSDSDVVELCRIDVDSPHRACCLIGFQAVTQAIDSPIDELETDGPTLAGPHLGDEC